MPAAAAAVAPPVSEPEAAPGGLGRPASSSRCGRCCRTLPGTSARAPCRPSSAAPRPSLQGHDALDRLLLPSTVVRVHRRARAGGAPVPQGPLGPTRVPRAAAGEDGHRDGSQHRWVGRWSRASSFHSVRAAGSIGPGCAAQRSALT